MNKEEENFLVRNLESGFLEIHMSKDIYKNLPERHRQLLKNKLRWSNPNDCWISKAQFDLSKAVIDRFSRIGFKDQGFKGKRLPFEKKIMQRLNKYNLIASKYDAYCQKYQINSSVYQRQAEKYNAQADKERDLFQKRALKAKVKLAKDKASTAMDRSKDAAENAAAYRKMLLLLELNLSNPRYLMLKLNQKRIKPLILKPVKNMLSKTPAPLIDGLKAERMLFSGRFKTSQEENLFYKNRLKTVVSTLEDDLASLYGKPVWLSKKGGEDSVGRVVGHQEEDGKLILKLNDGSYIAKELNKLTVLAPTHEILNLLQSKNSGISEAARASGLKALAFIKKDNLLEAMELVQKAGLSKYCLIRCNQYLSTQRAIKKSAKRSKALKL